MQTWVPPEYAEAIEAIARAQLLDVSDVIRQAIIGYLRQNGILPARPMTNGAAHHPARAEQ
jgi:hypothetical protein